MNNIIKKYAKKPFITYAKYKGKFIFVLSTGRVGTASLTKLLSLSDDCFSDHEPQSQFLELTKNAYHRQDYYKDNSSAIVKKYLESRLFTHSNSSQLRQSLLKGKVYAETSNRMTYIAPSLNKSLKNTSFIFVYRHPAEVVRSGMRRDYYNSHPWDPYRITPNPNDVFYNKWDELEQFDKCCWYWRGVNEFALNFMSSLPYKNCFKLTSESLFEPNIEKLIELFDWANISTPPRDKILELLSIPHNKQNSGNFPLYEDWPQDRRDRLIKIVGDLPKKLGYNL